MVLTKSRQCIRDEFDSRMATLIIYIVAFTVALAINDAIVTAINEYFGPTSAASKIIYALIVFVISIIVLWVVVKYIIPARSCNSWK